MDDKAYIRFLHTRKECPLRFMDRLVYSYLVYRKKPVSRREISSLLGLDKDTPSRIVRRLTDLGLVTSGSSGVCAVEPIGDKRDWFVWPDKLRTIKSWGQRIAYRKMYLPSANNPLTPAQNVVYCHLEPFGVIRANCSRIARYLSLDIRTVVSAVTALKELKLLGYDDGYWFVQKADLSWWQDRKKRSEATPEQGIYRTMIQEGGYSIDDVVNIRERLRKSTHGMEEQKLTELYHECERSNDRVLFPTSARLLLYKLKEYLEINERKWAASEMTTCSAEALAGSQEVAGLAYEERLRSLSDMLTIEQHASARVNAAMKKLPTWIKEHGKEKVWNSLKEISPERRISLDDFERMLTGKPVELVTVEV